MIYIVRGLLYGDEGKGTIVDYLSRENCIYVVKEGGPQAAHHIVSRGGKMHRSEQMSSGVFNKGVRTFCSKNMLVHIENLLTENSMLQLANVHDGMERMFIDSRCPIVTPLHKMLGRMKEVINRHGSTGLGVGEAVKDLKEKGDKVLTIGDFSNKKLLKEKLESLASEKYEEAQFLMDNNPCNTEIINILYEKYNDFYGSVYAKSMLNTYHNFELVYPSCTVKNGDEYLKGILESNDNVIFEGSQGALLDPEYGFVPYVTKTKTTFDTALELIGNKVPKSEISKIGVIRAYSTRHGAGPFVTEDEKLGTIIPDRFNKMNLWQGGFRIGWLDLLAVRYGIAVNKGVGNVAITNMDRLAAVNNINVCIGYEYTGEDDNGVDDFFVWECTGDKIIITDFNKRNWSTDETITKILFECKPIYKKFNGWRMAIHKAKSIRDLPKEAIEYINFLQEELNVPISIISVGVTSDDKILME